MTGGGGANTYFFGSGETGVSSAAADDAITDYTAADHFEFGLAAGSGSNYAEDTQADYATGLARANVLMDGTVIYVAIDIGADVVVFADTNADGTADQAVVLTGVADVTTISSANFV
jgi:hypothetical protein